MLKITKIFSLLAKFNENIKKTQKKFHLTWVTLGGGEAKMESGHTFFCFFLEPFP